MQKNLMSINSLGVISQNLVNAVNSPWARIRLFALNHSHCAIAIHHRTHLNSLCNTKYLAISTVQPFPPHPCSNPPMIALEGTPARASYWSASRASASNWVGCDLCI